MKLPKPYLLNILNAVEAIESYIPNSEQEFMNDPKSQDAILMRLQDIGENLITLRDSFPDFWEKNANDTWIKAIGLRNIISHDYGKIDLAIIWATANEDLKVFRQSIEQQLD